MRESMRKGMRVAISTLSLMCILMVSGCSEGEDYQKLYEEQRELAQSYQEELETLQETNLSLEVDADSMKTDLEALVEMDEEKSLSIEQLNEQVAIYEEELSHATELIYDLEQRVEFQRWNYEMVFISGHEESGRLNYLVQEKDFDGRTVNIVGEGYNQNGEHYFAEQLKMKGTGANEFVKFIITGTVYDFQLMKINYDDTYLVENAALEMIQQLDELTNQEVLIETSLSETMPFELVQWSDSQGNVYQAYLYYDGLGISGTLYVTQ